MLLKRGDNCNKATPKEASGTQATSQQPASNPPHRRAEDRPSTSQDGSEPKRSTCLDRPRDQPTPTTSAPQGHHLDRPRDQPTPSTSAPQGQCPDRPRNQPTRRAYPCQLQRPDLSKYVPGRLYPKGYDYTKLPGYPSQPPMNLMPPPPLEPGWPEAVKKTRDKLQQSISKSSTDTPGVAESASTPTSEKKGKKGEKKEPQEKRLFISTPDRKKKGMKGGKKEPQEKRLLNQVLRRLTIANPHSTPKDG